MTIRRFTVTVLVVTALAMPRFAHAQAGAVVNGVIGLASSDNASHLEVSGGIGYRFNRAIGFGVEFTNILNLDPSGDVVYPLYRICCAVADQDFEGHATVFTTNVRVEIPTALRRVIPFVVGGGGIASVTERFPIYYATPLASSAAPLNLSAVPVPNLLPGPQNYSTTTLAMALTLGGGASFLITDHVSIDGDLRVLKLLADNGRTIGRFQAGASYRF